MTSFKVSSSDGDIFEIDLKAAKLFGPFRSMLKFCDLENMDNTILPLPHVTSAILNKIIEWANHHKDDPEPKQDDNSRQQCTDDISEWDRNFLDVEEKTLYDLITATDYLDVKGLMDLACKKVANRIKGKTAEEIRALFDIENDLTPADLVDTDSELSDEDAPQD